MTDYDSIDILRLLFRFFFSNDVEGGAKKNFLKRGKKNEDRDLALSNSSFVNVFPGP